jgi:beta-N-acetylhexosaminidase
MTRRLPYLFLSLLLCTCTAKTEKPILQEQVVSETVLSESAKIKRYQEQAARIAASLDDRLLAAQVIIAGVDGKTHLNSEMKALLWQCPAGGLMLFSYNIAPKKEQVKSFLHECAEWVIKASGALVEAEGIPLDTNPLAEITRSGIPQGGIPPFIAIDHEGGSVHRFSGAAEKLPASFSYYELSEREGTEKALTQLEEDSARSAFEIRDLGITMNFAPVAELLSTENKIFLEDRSYGSDPVFTAAASAAFIRGME